MDKPQKDRLRRDQSRQYRGLTPGQSDRLQSTLVEQVGKFIAIVIVLVSVYFFFFKILLF